MKNWKDIDGYEGLYQVNTDGEIKSLPKIVNIANGATRIQPEKLMKLTQRGKDRKYLCVVLYKDKKRKMYSIHRLVASTFIENPKPNEYGLVMHKDDDPSNNCVDNLKWGNHSQNNEGRNQYTIKK